jgi:hypothetical protein
MMDDLKSINEYKIIFKGHRKFIKQLCHRMLLLSSDKLPYYSIENDGCRLAMWL